MLAAEAMKIALCATAVLGRRTMGLEVRVWCGLRHTLAFAVPASIYLVMNIMKVMAARSIPPPVFQLLASTKILATAIASWALLSKQLAPMQWMAMLLLTFGVALGQCRGSFSETASQDVPFFSLIIMIVNSFLSALGAVYTERVLKASNSAVLTTFATNLHMSAHTLLLNGAKAGILQGSALPRPWLFSAWTWAALINEAVNGLLVAALMRHTDSIVKNYAFAASIFATAGLSVPLLSYWPELSFFVGAVLVLVSMYLYARGASSTNHSLNGSKDLNGSSSNGHGSNGSSSNGSNGCHTETKLSNGSHDGTNGNRAKKE